MGALPIWLPELEKSDSRTVGQSDSEHEDMAFDAGLVGVDRSEIRDSVLITCFLSSDPASTLTRLKCSRAEIERGRRIGQFRDRWPDPDSAVEVRRWMSRVGATVDDLVCLAQVQGVAKGLEGAVTCVRDAGAPLAVGDLAVSGDDLLAAGVQMGPMVGKTLKRLLDFVLEDPTLNTKSELLARIAE